MPKTANFEQRAGKIPIPLAEHVPVDRAGLTPDPSAPERLDPQVREEILVPIDPLRPFKRLCFTRLKQGCFKVTFRPKGSHKIWGRRYNGTVRIEHTDEGLRFSGDLYSFGPFIIIRPPIAIDRRVERLRIAKLEDADEAADSPAADNPAAIPIYPRSSYYSYLKGISANLISLKQEHCPCTFSLTFEEYRYEHPATGFDGSFPAAPTRTIRFSLKHTSTADYYEGNVWEGGTLLGTVTMRWVSSSFRKATLVVHRLEGADEPQSVGAEYFPSVFQTAGWHLTVTSGGEVPLPDSLDGVQDPNDCWAFENMATLMESLPGYDPTELDSVWRAHLMAIPARLGCSRGWMFDSGTGNPNDIGREGAVTQSHDGYPAGDSSNFGAAEDGLQRDFPRAFLRSASHEVGHTFNQIHQAFEGGNDNSIMTTTPSVADVLAADGLVFPDDIHLGFNLTVRRHLVHLPDPAVRPGAIEFFGSAITAPQADQVAWLAELQLTIDTDAPSLALGEPLGLRWTITNTGPLPVAVPRNLDIASLTVRVSVTGPDGHVTFLRPAQQLACVQNTLRDLEPGKSLSGGTVVFWGRDGFTFRVPGSHVVEVMVLWQVGGIDVGVDGERSVWVSYPVSDKDNRVAALLFDREVGRAVALGRVPRSSEGTVRRLADAVKADSAHPAIAKLKKLGLFDTPRPTRRPTSRRRPKRASKRRKA
jgi:hypothetical protein